MVHGCTGDAAIMYANYRVDYQVECYGMYSDEILSISTLVTHVLGNGTNLQSSRPHLTSVKSSNSSQKVTGSVVLSNGL